MSIPTAIMLKICTPDPDMYSMIAFMGNAFAGEYANSHALAILSAAGSARFCVTVDDDFDLDCFCKRVHRQREAGVSVSLGSLANLGDAQVVHRLPC